MSYGPFKKAVLSAVLCLLLCLRSSSVYCPDNLPSTQYEALEYFYYSTNGTNWKIPSAQQWMFNASDMNAPCEGAGWYGIVCSCIVDQNSTRYGVSELNLPGVLVSGRFPISIGNLSDITQIKLNDNSLFGNIPSVLGSLNHLVGFNFGTNMLSGPLPSSLGNLNMMAFAVNNNFLTGHVPDIFGNMILYEALLNFNYFSGPLPPSLFQPTLFLLQVNNNKFSGDLSDSICRLTSVYELSINNNAITGVIPSCISSLFTVQTINAGNNCLESPLPNELSSLSIYALDISSNLFSGEFPSVILSMTHLRDVSMADNYFYGALPSSISHLTGISAFSIATNSFSGPIPSSISSMKVGDIYFNYNHFSQRIPGELGLMTNLNVLDLEYNLLSESIPPDIFNATILLELYLSNNFLTGQIPFAVSKCSYMFDLMLNNNQLSGSIPTTLAALSSLSNLMLNNNKLTGSLPSQIGSLTSLFDLYLYSNRLRGSIPSALGNMNSLSFFWISSNSFSGYLPSSLSKLSNLIEFLVNDNQFSGPSFEIFNSTVQTSLQIIDFGNNLFSGTIASQIGDFAHLSTIIAVSNCYSGTIPSEFCNLRNSLVSLSLDGLSSNMNCPANIRINQNKPAFVSGKYQGQVMKGTIPSCFFSLPNLEVLHISGNALGGTLSNIPIDSKLQDLSVSNNQLSGSIPSSIQRHSFLYQLNLGYNQLSGTLVGDFVVTPTQVSLTLAENRISGVLPNAIASISDSYVNMTTLDVLSSNVFDCKHGIPEKDSYARSYYCESSELNNALYLWSAMFTTFIVSCLVLYILFYKGYFQNSTNMLSMECSRLMKCVIQWNSKADSIKQSPIGIKESSSTIIEDTLIETRALLFSLDLLQKWSFICLMVLLFIFFPLCMSLSVNYSYITFSYAFQVSTAYLDEYIPVVCFGVTLFIFLLWSFFLVNFNHLEIQSFLEGNGFRESILYFNRFNPKHAFSFRAKKYSLLFIFHVINVVVTISVNAAYVNAILNNRQLTRFTILLIQIAVGFFKIVWNTFYVPWASRILVVFMSEARAMQNRYCMALMNFIIAPCVATLVTNQSCFYFVFKPYDPINSETIVSICSGFTTDSVTHQTTCFSTEMSTFYTSFYPSFTYGYTCGAALLTTYIPVFLYVYCSVGIIAPLGRLLIALYPVLLRPSKWISDILFLESRGSLSVQGSEEEVRRGIIRVKGKGVIITLLQHFSVLFTFGMACPLLGIPVTLAIIVDIFVWKVLTGRYIVLSSFIWYRFYSTEPNIKSESNSQQSIDLALLEDDVKFSWQGTKACFGLLVLVTCLFWGALFFDMIADYYDIFDGTSAAIIFGVVPPVILLMLRMFLPSSSVSKIGREMTSCLNLSYPPVKARTADSDAEARTNSMIELSFSASDVSNELHKGHEFL